MPAGLAEDLHGDGHEGRFRPATTAAASRFREALPADGIAMLIFWTVAALFLAGALLLLLPALLRPAAAGPSLRAANLSVHDDQLREAEADLANGTIAPAAAAQARRELARRAAADLGAGATTLTDAEPARRTALALALLLPLVAVPLYLLLGQPEAAAPRLASPSAPPAAAAASGAARHALGSEQIQQMVTALGERLQANPADAEGWQLLGRSYTALGRYRDAATALRRAADLVPGNASLLADLADVLGMAQNKRLAGEPARLIQQALDLDPRHIKALALAGSAAFETGDWAAARGYWERLVPLLPADSPMARSIRGSIAEATQLEGGQTAPASVEASAITGRVQVSADLAARVPQGGTLFVFARAAEGSRVPLAVWRQPLDGRPLSFRLDDTLAMSPALRLSGATRVLVGARLSASGNATPQAGDLIGQSEPVAPGTRDLVVRIDRVQP
jgi:cytochrome c-type biogenesis protein CcmH